MVATNLVINLDMLRIDTNNNPNLKTVRTCLLQFRISYVLIHEHWNLSKLLSEMMKSPNKI